MVHVMTQKMESTKSMVQVLPVAGGVGPYAIQNQFCVVGTFWNKTTDFFLFL